MDKKYLKSLIKKINELLACIQHTRLFTCNTIKSKIIHPETTVSTC